MSMTTDLLCIGESMAVLSGPGPRLHLGAPLVLGAGGAESNVAVGVAAEGLRASWASLLGDDPVGDLVLSAISDRGVDVGAVQRRPLPTGLYLKDERGPIYRRAGSAASTMDRSFALDLADGIRPRVVHVSGITAQISSQGVEMLEAICLERVFGDAVVSFDVNHRPALANARTAHHLLRFAAASDIVLVGADEAERVWGLEERELRSHITAPFTLVVKNAGVDAAEYGADSVVRVPATPVEVLEPTGAGDAFAAGWLSGYLRGERAAERLAAGHRAAVRVLGSIGDTPDQEEA